MEPEINFPYKIEDIEPEEKQKLAKYYKVEYNDFVRVGPKGYFLPQTYRQEAAKIYNTPIRASDIFVSSFPRSGTTWTQELVWMLANDLDYETTNSVLLSDRYEFLEISIFSHEEHNKHLTKKVEIQSPRFIKTHMPLSLLPPTLLASAKLVYVARDPRDVAVSYYHLNKLYRARNYEGNFKTFWDFFKSNLNYWTPYFEHLKEAWAQRKNPNMFFLFYEELSKDLKESIHHVSEFLGKKFSDEEIERLCNHLNFENFKNNKTLNGDERNKQGRFNTGVQGFIRKGKTGGWRDYFDEEMTQQADQWIKDNLKDTDLRFPHMKLAENN